MQARGWLVLAAVRTTGRAGFLDDNFRKKWQRWFQALPYPAGEILAGGIFQSGDIVKIIVVEGRLNRLEGRTDIGKILHPTLLG